MATSDQLHFETRGALACLPWFEEDHGQLVLSDKSIGPIIDVHTHYALPAFRHDTIDLDRETPDSNLLLGACCAHHLDLYANQCFHPDDLRSLKRELAIGLLTARGKRKDHTAPNMARDMRSMGIVHSVVIGVDLGFVSTHPARTLAVARTRTDVTGYGSLHPRSLNARIKFEEQLHQGARGMKIHPPNMLVRPDAPSAMRIYKWCGEAGIPVFWHCGPAGIEPKLSQYCGQVRFYEKPLSEHPRTTFILGHTGALQHREALALFKKYPNAYVDVSCLSIAQLKEVLDEGDPERILFGSDWPFYHPVLPLAKVLMLTEGREPLRRKILYENAARLLDETRVETGRASTLRYGDGKISKLAKEP